MYYEKKCSYVAFWLIPALGFLINLVAEEAVEVIAGSTGELRKVPGGGGGNTAAGTRAHCTYQPWGTEEEGEGSGSPEPCPLVTPPLREPLRDTVRPPSECLITP